MDLEHPPTEEVAWSAAFAAFLRGARTSFVDSVISQLDPPPRERMAVLQALRDVFDHLLAENTGDEAGLGDALQVLAPVIGIRVAISAALFELLGAFATRFGGAGHRLVALAQLARLLPGWTELLQEVLIVRERLAAQAQQMPLDDSLLVGLQRAIDSDADVELENTFRGLPVSYPATVVRLEDGTLTLTVNRYQRIAIAQERLTRLRVPGVNGLWLADVVQIDADSGEVLVQALRPAPPGLGLRRLIRLQPALAVAVRLSAGPREWTAQLVDVSMSGAGVVVAGEDAPKRGAIVGLAMELTDAMRQVRRAIRGSAEVLYQKREDGAVRLGLRTHLDPKSEAALAAYMGLRQTEIVRELRMRA